MGRLARPSGTPCASDGRPPRWCSRWLPGPDRLDLPAQRRRLGVNILEVIILDTPAHEVARYTLALRRLRIFDVDAERSGLYILEGSLASLLLPSDYASARQ